MGGTLMRLLGDGLAKIMPNFVGMTNGASSATVNLTVAKAAGVVEGDFMVMVVAGFAATVPSPPSGWTQQIVIARTASSSSYVFTKFAGPSEPASYTVVLSTAGSGQHTGSMTAYRNVNPDNPVIAAAGRPTSGVLTGVIIDFGLKVEANSLAVAGTTTATANSVTSMTWTGATERTDYVLSSGNRYIVTVGTAPYAEAGNMPTTGVQVVRAGTAGGWQGWAVFCLVLRGV